jgi:hypothetical protein
MLGQYSSMKCTIPLKSHNKLILKNNSQSMDVNFLKNIITSRLQVGERKPALLERKRPPPYFSLPNPKL